MDKPNDEAWGRFCADVLSRSGIVQDDSSTLNDLLLTVARQAFDVGWNEGIRRASAVLREGRADG